MNINYVTTIHGRSDVVLENLSSASKLNGQRGVLIGWSTSKERYSVRLNIPDPKNTNKPLFVYVKPKNIFHMMCPRVRLQNGSTGRIHDYKTTNPMEGNFLQLEPRGSLQAMFTHTQSVGNPLEQIPPRNVSVLLDETGGRVKALTTDLERICEQVPGIARLACGDDMWDQAYEWHINGAGTDCEEALINLSPLEVYQKVKKEVLAHTTYDGLILSKLSWR